MNKKIYSSLVVFFTAIYLFINVFLNSSAIKCSISKFDIRITNMKNTALNKIEDLNRSLHIEYDGVQQKSQITISDREYDFDNNDEKIELTEYEKERLLSLSKKLSSIDKQKISTYLEGSTAKEVANAINLLKQRLPDKEYESIRDLGSKYDKVYGSTKK
ncbi:hypothetical protein JK636_08410 [Clostridium sp. YIM B02515]|uniref:Uncharacterized protein n=1 Tax=Clostridium rhizosphaerae TaxID=2803861 RepID=A0ABS1TBU4_9CLOT|nr:hypothetical protein [Clostridium rhizosphaerae]MBL4935779.1 hypothetical protein [Clostridium rhizosphaerae]